MVTEKVLKAADAASTALFHVSLAAKGNMCADFFVCGVDDLNSLFLGWVNPTAVYVKLGVFSCHLLHLFLLILSRYQRSFFPSNLSHLFFQKD